MKRVLSIIAKTMPTFTLITDIRASPSRCFDLSRDLDLHQQSFSHTREVIIAGRAAGLIELGEEVTWQAKHFGIYHTHTAKITQYNRPSHFRDEMIQGRFKQFEHDHYFEVISPTTTRMTDVLTFRSPLGVLGSIVDALMLKRYLHNLLAHRAAVIRLAAES